MTVVFAKILNCTELQRLYSELNYHMHLELIWKDNYVIGYEGKDICSPFRVHILLVRGRKNEWRKECDCKQKESSVSL